MNVAFKDSMVQGNNYTFHCPIVDRDALFIACVFKKHKHWRGEDFRDHDCKCAMNGSKCPVVYMLAHEHKDGERHYMNEDKTVHKLPRNIIAHVEPVLLQGCHAHRLELTEEQRLALFGRKIEIPTVDAVIEKPARKPRKAKSQSEDMIDQLDNVNDDMSNAINQAIRE